MNTILINISLITFIISVFVLGAAGLSEMNKISFWKALISLFIPVFFVFVVLIVAVKIMDRYN